MEDIEEKTAPAPSSPDSDISSSKDLATRASRSSSQARNAPSLQRMSKTRSQNGYGCDDNEAGHPPHNGNVENGTPEKDPWEVHWDGDDDPLNPRSMNAAKKWVVVLIVSASSLCVTCTSSMYTSTYAQTTVEFHCSRIVATLGLSLFIMGLGIGPMLLGPLSEFYGRRPIYIASFSFFVIWLIPSAVARNIQTMLIARFLDGLSGSAFLSVAGGTVGDMYNREQLQLPMMIYTGSPFVGPTIGRLCSWKRCLECNAEMIHD